MSAIITVTPNPVLDRTLTVPRITFDEMVRATESRLDWGGKGFNVSRALKALGEDTIAMGFVGGAAGQQLERGLSEMGIHTDFVHLTGETRTNVIIAEADTERYVKVNEAGPTVQTHEVAALLDRVDERARPGEIWVLSGSLPPGVPTDFYARLIDLLQTRGAKALLDSSGEPLALGCAAGPYLVKPNAAEAEQVTGHDANCEFDALRAAEFFLHQGVKLVALSAAADGLLLASKQQAVWAQPPRVRAQNPVGAGDALLAGVAWALQSDLCFEDVARWAVAAGTAAASRKGVSVGTHAEVDALYGKVRVTNTSMRM